MDQFDIRPPCVSPPPPLENKPHLNQRFNKELHLDGVCEESGADDDDVGNFPLTKCDQERFIENLTMGGVAASTLGIATLPSGN